MKKTNIKIMKAYVKKQIKNELTNEALLLRAVTNVMADEMEKGRKFQETEYGMIGKDFLELTTIYEKLLIKLFEMVDSIEI